ncbi:hypothetical protein BDZ89DRAFT_1130158 [Hymenopellis radicata]|nr:hypothetical protein BDZ89DRAFT_1130158 [Hymenopellis radicata]
MLTDVYALEHIQKYVDFSSSDVHDIHDALTDDNEALIDALGRVCLSDDSSVDFGSSASSQSLPVDVGETLVESSLTPCISVPAAATVVDEMTVTDISVTSTAISQTTCKASRMGDDFIQFLGSHKVLWNTSEAPWKAKQIPAHADILILLWIMDAVDDNTNCQGEPRTDNRLSYQHATKMLSAVIKLFAVEGGLGHIKWDPLYSTGNPGISIRVQEYMKDVKSSKRDKALLHGTTGSRLATQVKYYMKRLHSSKLNQQDQQQFSPSQNDLAHEVFQVPDEVFAFPWTLTLLAGFLTPYFYSSTAGCYPGWVSLAPPQRSV